MERERIPKERLLDMLLQMDTIREFENEAIELAKANLTRAAIHTYNGQEAIAVGVCASLTNNDSMLSTHRGHGHCIAKGADPVRMFAELMARETGYCKGKGGSMHIADLSTGMLGANGIVGGGIPLSAGAALAKKLQHTKDIVVCFFGDGASNEGAFHEALNFASVFQLPVVFICENNQYGISTPVTHSTHCKHIADRAIGYGMEGVTLDGNDIEAVYFGFRDAAEKVRAGGGPILLEMLTYRMSGHYYGDNENYRTREEVLSWREKDPIKHCRELLTEQYGVTAEEMDAIGKETKAMILAAAEEAKLAPEPSPDKLADDLYDPTFEDIQWKPFVKQA